MKKSSSLQQANPALISRQLDIYGGTLKGLGQELHYHSRDEWRRQSQNPQGIDFERWVISCTWKPWVPSISVVEPQ